MPTTTEQSGGSEASPSNLEHVSREDIDDALREIDELCECWNNRLTVENLALAERYLKGELEFGVVFVTHIGHPSVGTEFVAIFERKLSVSGRASQHGIGGQMIKTGASYVPPYSEHLVRCGYRDEQLMFVGDVQTVQTIQGIAPSTVRLQSVDEFERIR